MIDAALHFGGELLLPFADPASRTYAPLLALAALIAFIFHRLTGQEGGWKHALGLHLWRHKSSVLDFQEPTVCETSKQQKKSATFGDRLLGRFRGLKYSYSLKSK